MPQLKDNLQELLDSKHWSGRELARQSNQKVTDIYNILYGKSKKPSADKVQAIANALGVSVSTILYGKQDAIEPTLPDEEWDGLLYNDCMTIVRDILAKQGVTFSSREDEKNSIMKFTMRVYTYARKRKEITADRIFAEDIISN